MVIDRAWRALGPGLEALSGPQGAPLTRSVKLIVLPLVVRPSLHPDLAADFLEGPQAARLEELVRQAGDPLRATAQWFTRLKKARRALGVVAGNPQDLYFQPCFELATRYGAPAAGADERARAVVEELAEAGGGRTVEALKDHLADPDRQARLDAALAAPGGARRGDRAGDRGALSADEQRLAALALDALEACGGADGTGPGAAFTALLDGAFGTLVGRLLWARTSGLWGRDDLPTHLELTAHPRPPRPRVGRGASTATLPAPLDRTLFERLFGVLQASVRREELPPVAELVRREVGRSCAPLGLHDESLRVAVVLGGRLAVGLDPLGGGDPELRRTAAHRVVNGRWQREASVLRARRMTTGPDAGGGALAALAEDLRTPWVPYMRRLWVRLHGRDVREAAFEDLAALWAVLDGVARSVMMDHRARVRAALRALSVAPAAGEARSA
ncbi:hypothetical protein GCM10009665_54220 [Kitasatospora nipponensis]|uniref:Lantibiotic biosynthesis dehydratase-like protein n=2 Tax=Kitasatospora nipponensis TaxID=258049 RepID=A0ABN1WNH7_9ACTN